MAALPGPKPKYGLLKDVYPALASEVVESSLLDTLSSVSGRKILWRCRCHGFEWTATVANRTRGAGHCYVVGGKKPVPGINDLATTHPELAAELVDQLIRCEVKAGSGKRVEWQCAVHDHRWTTTVADRALGGRGCPICAGRSVVPGINDLATTHPELASELVDETLATRVSFGSDVRAEWKCSLGHRWSTQIKNRTAGDKTKCPVCSNKKIVPGINDLATTHPELASELVDQTVATSHSAGSPSSAEWRCEQGHRWKAVIASRVYGCGCPVCSNKLVVPGVNDLATTHPDLAAELVDKTIATTRTAGSNVRTLWRCECHGYEWETTIGHRTGRPRRCPIATSKAVMPGVNDLATTHPDLAAELVDQTAASAISFGSERILEWRCETGHTWPARVNRRVHGSGCTVCKPARFEPDAPSVVYVLSHDDFRLLKVGVANCKSDRIDNFIRHGWKHIAGLAGLTGSEALEVEAIVLHYARAASHPADLGARRSLTVGSRLSGQTEMVDCYNAAVLEFVRVLREAEVA